MLLSNKYHRLGAISLHIALLDSSKPQQYFFIEVFSSRRHKYLLQLLQVFVDHQPKYSSLQLAPLPHHRNSEIEIFDKMIDTAVWTGIEMSRDFFVKTSLTFFLPNNSSNQDSNGWEGITVVHGGHLRVILVVIFGFRQWEFREGQNMAQNRPRVYEYTFKVFLFGTLYRPLNRSRIPEKDSNQLGNPFGVHFWCPRPIQGPLQGSEANSFALGLQRQPHSGPYFDLL